MAVDCNSGGTTSTSRTQLPSWLNKAARDVGQHATALLDKNFKPYTGDVTADFTPLQQSTFQNVQNVFGGGGIDPATGYQANDLSSFIQQVAAASGHGPAQVGGGQWQDLLNQFTSSPAWQVGGPQFNSWLNNFGNAGPQNVGDADWRNLVNNVSGTPASRVGGDQWQGIINNLVDTDPQHVGSEDWRNMINQFQTTGPQQVGGDQWANLISQFTNAPASTVGGGGTLDAIRRAMEAGPQQVGTERVVDEGGRLGDISSYLNPYLEANLDPTIRRIDEEQAQRNLALKGQATTAHAFGDARHGILEGANQRETQRAISEASASAHAAGYDTAMQERTGDLNRFLSSDLANAQFGEQALGRVFQGAGLELGAQTTNAGLQEAFLNRLRGGAQDILGEQTTQGNFNEQQLGRLHTGAQDIYGSEVANANYAQDWQQLQRALAGDVLGQETTNAGLLQQWINNQQTAAGDLYTQQLANANFNETALGRQRDAADELLKMQQAGGQFYENYLNRLQGGERDLLAMQTQQGNFDEAAWNRQITGATTGANITTADQQNFLARAQALLGIGGAQQSLNQNDANFALQQYYNKQQWPFDKLQAVSSALNATPANSRTTQTSQTDTSLADWIKLATAGATSFVPFAS